MSEILEIILNGDGCWPDLQHKPWKDGRIVSIAVLPRGTQEGRASVTVRVETSDGTIVLGETTLRLLAMAIEAFKAKYPEQEGPA